MKSIFILLGSLLLTSPIFAQVDSLSNSVRLEKTVVTLSLLPPGISLEKAISHKNSLYFYGYTGLVFSKGFKRRVDLDLYPQISAQYRSYYNLQKRHNRGKYTSNNSGNYIGVLTAYSFDAIRIRDRRAVDIYNGLTVGPVWGIQRNKTVSFGLTLGLGVTFYRGNPADIGPIGSLNLGFNLSKKKDR